MISIPDIFKEKDTIYHYTKTEVAVEHIFYSNKLKFSPIANSIDTIERSRFNTGMVYIGADEDLFQEIHNKNIDHINEVEKRIDSLFNTAKILCFCENDLNDKYISANIYRKDYYGFLKPRMWDQYGENYKGVCLAFSKTKLLNAGSIDYFQNIRYVDYDNFDLNFSRISLNSLNNIGIDLYYENVQNTIIDGFLKKHKDYKDENEFRLLSVKNNNQLLDISESICGIIVSPQLIRSRFMMDEIINYSKKMNIELLYLSWNKNGVTITSKDWMQI